MKKYVKPDLYYENFELSHSIANCHVEGDDINGNGRLEERANLSDGNTCTYDIGIPLFTSGNGNCIEDYFDSSYEKYCYQTGSSGDTLFSS